MNYAIVEGAIALPDVMALLKQTYWANKRTPEQVQRSMDNSRCYGIYLDGEQKLVGFARVISDFATTYYLCDVVIDRDHQHNGLGVALVSHIENRPEYQGLRGMLITRDAHTLYEKFGYQTLNGRAMVKGLNC
ncbi:MAG: GNAT family N-acetyltransferase [Oscillospiraceae bacterium]|nr:GNAT family N-acetyltransferase [Oscillospiraceae bacterium]